MLAAIGLGDAVYAREFRKETAITFPLFIDEQRQAYRAAELKSANLLHLLRGDNAEARKRAHNAGHHQHKLGKIRFSSAEVLFSVQVTSTFFLTRARRSVTTPVQPLS